MRISDWSSDVCSSDLLNSSKTETAEAHGAIGFLTLPTIARMKIRPWEMMRHYADGARYTWVSPDGTPFVEAPKISGQGTLNMPAAQAIFAGAKRSPDEVPAEADKKGTRPKGHLPQHTATTRKNNPHPTHTNTHKAN